MLLRELLKRFLWPPAALVEPADLEAAASGGRFVGDNSNLMSLPVVVVVVDEELAD